MKEIFKDIPNYEGYYQVSNLGRVKSLNFNGTKKERNLKGTLSCGYLTVGLCKGGIRKTYKISQLVAIVFLDHKPDGFKIIVDHINNIRTDDRLENLQLITTRENTSKDQEGKSKYTGVCWHKQHKKWKADIRINGAKKWLGYFDDEKEASKAYQKALKNLK